MPNPSKRTRDRLGDAVLALLRDHGLDAHCNPPAGNLDVGDLRFTDRERRHGRGGVARPRRRSDLAGGMNELAVETAYADAAVRGAGGEAPVAPDGPCLCGDGAGGLTAALVAPEEA